MNAKDRKELQKALDLLAQAREIVATIQQQEDEKFENLSDGLKETERGQKLSDNAYALSDIESDIDSMESTLTDLIES